MAIDRTKKNHPQWHLVLLLSNVFVFCFFLLFPIHSLSFSTHLSSFSNALPLLNSPPQPFAALKILQPRDMKPLVATSSEFRQYQEVFRGRLASLYSIVYDIRPRGLFVGWNPVKYFHGTSHCGCLTRNINTDAFSCNSHLCATRGILCHGFSRIFVRRCGGSLSQSGHSSLCEHSSRDFKCLMPFVVTV
jgi:hypothetical protein